MEFRKEMNGIALAMVAGIWASVAVGQGQGPGIEALLLPDPAPAPSAPAAAKVPEPVTAKSAEKAPAPEAAKPVTGKYKIVKEEKPAPVEQVAAKAPVAKPAEQKVETSAAKSAKPDVKADVSAKPVKTAPVPVAEKPVPKAKKPKPETKVVKEEKAVPPVQKAEKKAEKPVSAAAAKPVEKTPTVAAKPAEKKPAAAVDEDTDEINLNEVDDSAVAAKGRPLVKLAPQAPVSSVTSDQPTADGKASPKAPPAPETGSAIAARFLAGDETALVDISSDDATLTDILRQFRRATGANIIYAESTNLQQRVSVSLKHVPWLEGMKSILNSRGFRVESSGGIHFVKEDKTVEPIFTRTFQLNHASVDELAKLFNESYGTKGKDGKLVKGVATPFQGANTIVVTANERTLADCETIIKAVDKAVPQIYIEARFIELSNEALHKLGVQWDQLESWGASVRDVSAGMGYANGRSAVYRNGHTDKYFTAKDMVQTGNTENDTSTESSSISDGSASRSVNSTKSSNATFTDLADGRSLFDYRQKDYLKQANELAADSPMAWRNSRVFSGQLSVQDFTLAMSAFESMSDAKVFSNPRIIVSNGREAKVDMTTKYPNVTIDANYTGQNSQNLSISTKLDIIPGEDKFMFAKEAFFSWGIQLSVTPRISPDGLISVEIVPTISDHKGDVIVGSAASQDFPYAQYPIIEIKRLLTEFTMKDGATAVIGGLSKTEEGDVDSGIPYLRKIPWIGQKLFGWKSREKTQKEILIFVTVGIADPANLPEDIGLPKNAVRGREYVEKRAFEPGDRPDAANDVLKLDMTAVDARRAEDKKKSDAGVSSESGTVTITPVVPEKE